MKSKFIVVVFFPILITLGIQAVMLFQLSEQINLLTVQVNQNGSSQISLPNLPTLMLPKQECESVFPRENIESF
jgi:hypothetical protein